MYTFYEWRRQDHDLNPSNSPNLIKISRQFNTKDPELTVDDVKTMQREYVHSMRLDPSWTEKRVNGEKILMQRY